MEQEIAIQEHSILLDFEFNQTVEKHVNLVSCATYDPATGKKIKWWLHKDRAKKYSGKAEHDRDGLRDYLNTFKTVIGYSCVAECRSFLSLGLEPLDFEWIDLFFEYRCLTNHNDNLQWGKQLVDGTPKFVRKPKPKWERTEEDDATGFKATHSLAEATYRLTGKIRDTAHKTAMRDLIISDPDTFSKKDREDIENYNLEDVIFLPTMLRRTVEEFLKLDPSLTVEKLIEEMKVRGRYAAHTAHMESHGYPIDVEKTRNFSKQVPQILYDCQKEINKLFPEIKPFRWEKKATRFAWNQKTTRQWIEATGHSDKWKKTDKSRKFPEGQLSLALEAFTQFFDFKHTYPKDNLGAQFVRYLKLKQNLAGFSRPENSSKKGFWDSVGSDGMVRPYMNPFGAQSSRSQPGATGFMFLKPAWMRALVVPPKGYFMAGIDYGSQEFFIQALRANDKAMIEAYLSGDVYLYFAIKDGAIPVGGTKATHKIEREAYKSTILGISFLMTKYGLAIKLTNDLGIPFTEEQAQEKIDAFYSIFSGLSDYQDLILSKYDMDRFIKLPCSWYCWGDNENFRSITNVPTQGEGASILRKAVDLARAKGCNVIKTLHDAVYIMEKVGDEHKIAILRDSMREAFAFYYPENMKKLARQIRLDPFAWSPDYPKDSEIEVGKHKWKVPVSNLYVDDRSIEELNQFSKYFEKPDWHLL